MNGKSLLITLGTINPRYYVEAENDTIRKDKKNKNVRHSILIAAIIALTLLLVGCALAYASGWLTGFFNKQSNGPLSSAQLDYIRGTEQLIGESQTHDKWTIQLKSAINDGRTAYIVLGITAPKKIDLESTETTAYFLGDEFAELVSNNRQIEILSEESGWESDDDELSNTMDYIIRFEPMQEDCSVDPYSTDVKWTIHIENIVCQSEDREYYLELLNGKYKGQNDFWLTAEENDRLYQQEVIANGIWNFTFSFQQSGNGLELVSAPTTVRAYVTRKRIPSYEDVIITTFTLNPFSVEISHKADALVTFTNPKEETVVVVMRDGSEIELRHFSATRNTTVLNCSVPIVITEVDHIRMPDGTVLTPVQ